MKAYSTLGALALASLGVAAQTEASAHALSPVSSTFTATGIGKANVTNVKVSAPLTGTCGPGTVPITASGAHITFSGVVINPGACSVKGTITDKDSKTPGYISAK